MSLSKVTAIVSEQIGFDLILNEVLNITNSLDLNKSLSHDNVSLYFLRMPSIILAPDFCYFNRIILNWL